MVTAIRGMCIVRGSRLSWIKISQPLFGVMSRSSVIAWGCISAAISSPDSDCSQITTSYPAELSCVSMRCTVVVSSSITRIFGELLLLGVTFETVGRCFLSAARGRRKTKATSLAQLTLQGESATLQLDQTFGDGEPQS